MRSRVPAREFRQSGPRVAGPCLSSGIHRFLVGGYAVLFVRRWWQRPRTVVPVAVLLTVAAAAGAAVALPSAATPRLVAAGPSLSPSPSDSASPDSTPSPSASATASPSGSPPVADPVPSSPA